MTKIIPPTNEDQLLCRVFTLIAEAHFVDNKMIPYYVVPIRFPRQLGEDLAKYMQGHHGNFYNRLKKHYETKELTRRKVEAGKPIQWHEKKL